MRKLFVPAIFGLASLTPGCSFIENICRNLVNEPTLVCDQHQIRKRNRFMGETAFCTMIKQYGDNFSEAYRDGFIDGFSDYLTYGGCVHSDGERPVVPPTVPVKYQRKQYMTPEGYQAMEDWFAGFRHGGSTAAASGLRQLVVLPVFDPPRFGADDAMQADYGPGTKKSSSPTTPVTTIPSVEAVRPAPDASKTATPEISTPAPRAIDAPPADKPAGTTEKAPDAPAGGGTPSAKAADFPF